MADLAPSGTTVLPMSAIPDSSKQPPSNEDQGRKIIWSLISAIFVVVIVIAASTVYVIIRKRRRNRRIREPYEEEERMLLLNRSKRTEKLQRNIAEAITKHYSKINSWYWEEELSPAAMDELYTEQAFTKVTKSGIKTTRTLISGYSEIFPKDTNSTFTYLEGTAGSGKTTLCRKILADWALQISTNFQGVTQNKVSDKISPFNVLNLPRKHHVEVTTEDNYISRFKFVLPIFLRNVKRDDDIISAVQRQLSLSGADKNLLEHLLHSEPDQFLFILDGYDEYSEDTSTEITSLAKWTIYPGVSVLMTSRYTPYEHFVPSNFPNINHIILEGYLQESISCYLKKFLSSEEDCHLLEEKLSGSDLQNIAGNPSVLFLICILFKHTKKLPSTTTQFFKELTQYICGRYECKMGNRPQQTNVLETYHANLMEICEIAAEGSLDTPMMLYFDRSSTKKKMKKDGSWNLGLFVAEHGPESEGKVRFPHRTYQDFLAAYYILHLKDGMKKEKIYMKLLKSTDSVKKWKWILSHLLGLGSEPVLDAFKDLIQGAMPMVETTVHLLFLSEHPTIQCPLPRIIDVCPRDYPEFLISAFFCQNGDKVEQIIFRASRIAQIWPIDLLHAPNLKSLHVYQSMEYGPSGDVIKEVDKIHLLVNLEKLVVRGIQIIDDLDQRIISKIITNSESLITFEYTDSDFVQMKTLLRDLTKRNISEIRLRNNTISDKDMHRLFEHFSSWPSLRVLDLFGNTAMVESFKGLPENLFHLQELRLCACQLEAIDECFAAFNSMHSLRVIDLRGEEKQRRDITPDVIQNIPDKSDEYRQFSRALARANHLQELRLKTSKYLDAIEPLLDCFQSMYELEILDVAKTIATRPIYEKLGKVLPRMKRIRELRLCDCLYRDKGAGLSLVKSLSSMRGLRILELGHYSLNEEALFELSKNLQHFTELSELLMYYTDACDFGIEDIGGRRSFEKAWSRLLSQIGTCKLLRILDLKGNQIGNESVSQLSKQMLKLRKLEILMLDHCHLDKVAPVMELFSKLSKCPVLKELELSNNTLGKQLVQLTDRDIQLDPHINVNLSNNGIPEEDKERLRNTFKNGSKVTL